MPTFDDVIVALRILKTFCHVVEKCQFCPLCTENGDCQIIKSGKVPESWVIYKKVEL